MKENSIIVDCIMVALRYEGIIWNEGCLLYHTRIPFIVFWCSLWLLLNKSYQIRVWTTYFSFLSILPPLCSYNQPTLHFHLYFTFLNTNVSSFFFTGLFLDLFFLPPTLNVFLNFITLWKSLKKKSPTLQKNDIWWNGVDWKLDG